MTGKNKVFCIGLGRTGTTTFQDCMQLLGYKHRGWSGPELGLLAMLDLKSILPTIDTYESFDDYPFPLIYKQLAEIYPESKFVLTKRKSADLWADSVIRESNRKRYNDSDNIWYEGELSSPNRRTLLINRYNSHIDSVNRFFSGSPNFLEVCWEEGDDWQLLCNFLNQPVPLAEFPHRNKGKKMSDQDLIDSFLAQKSYCKALLHVRESTDASYVINKLKDRLVSNEQQSSNSEIGLLGRIIKKLLKN